MKRERRKAAMTALVAVAIIAAFGIAKSLFPAADVPQKGRAAISRFAINGLNKARVDGSRRLAPTIRPGLPLPQHPTSPTTRNSDDHIPLAEPFPRNLPRPATQYGSTEASQGAPIRPQHSADERNEEIGKPPREWTGLTDDWNGLRSQLETHGVTVAGGFATYLGKSLGDGAHSHKFGEAYLLNLNVTFDSKKLAGYEGGTFFINFRNENGLHNHSLDGSFGDTSHLYSPARTEVSEAWYEQKLLDDKVRIRLGKIDANTEFAFVANGGEFLNDFAGYNATILDFPTDPDPAFGAEIFVYPSSHFYAGIAVFDGSALEGAHTGLLGPAHIGKNPSQFWIGEIGTAWTAPGKRDGRLGVGVWHHTDEFKRFDGGTKNGASGPYITFDQTLWRKAPDTEDSARGIAMFALAGYANPTISAAQYEIGGGLRWAGPLPSRDSDILGLGASYIHFSDVPGAGFDERGELTVETFYKIRFNPWFSIQPDLQFIHNPDGVSSHHDAVAATVQMLVDF